MFTGNNINIIVIVTLIISIFLIVYYYTRKYNSGAMQSPVSTLIQIMGIVFVAESLTMLLLYYLFGHDLFAKHMFIDAAILCILSAPLIYLIIVRPLNLEIELQVSRAQGIVENAADAIVTVDEYGAIKSLNPAAEELFGYRKENIIGQNISMLIYDSVENRFQSSLRRFLKKDEAKSERAIIEAVGEKYDGSVLQLRISIGVHAAEKHKLFTVIMHDVSERKREEEFYRNAFKNSPIGIFILHEGRFKFVNLKFEEYTGHSAEELLEMESMDLVAPEDRGLVRENAINMLKGNKSTPYEYRIVLQNGDVKWVMETAASIDYRGARSTLGTIVDIDGQKSLNEALSRTNEELSGRVEELTEHNKHMALLNEMGEVIQSNPTLEETYKTINHYARQFFPDKSGALCLLDQSGECVEVVSEWGETSGFKNIYNPNECWALRRGKVHMVKDREHDLYCEHVDPSLTGGYFCIPLIAQNNILGVLNLYNNRTEAAVAEQKTFEYKSRLATYVADYASLSISSLKLQEKLHERSIHDPLTGLYNRRYMDKALEREVIRAVNLARPLGVILMDIDHFKKFNDTYGHKAGDKVLAEIAKLLNKNIRQEDIACRYGGEEFLFILPGSTLEATKQRAEDLREEVKGLRIKYSDLTLTATTLSLGVAAVPDHGITPDALLEAADQALYVAKNEGRDRVVVKLPYPINAVTHNNLEHKH